ncbi:hypothetical protein HZA33_03725 [Candidatus Pacearchaeota archaeon]|nr:hypothetical protein [Candidatus Pacearchaeota archaeon]
MYDTTKPYKEKILEIIKSTWDSAYVHVKNQGSQLFPGEFDHVDGIGTKGIYHWQRRTFKNAVLDALAMNFNDDAMLRATPYALQDHIFLPKDDESAILEIISTLAEECIKRHIAITAGETAIHNNMEGLEISITTNSYVNEKHIKKYSKNKFEIDDVLIGIASNGLHSNGFTKVREIFGNEFREDFVRPTEIYLSKILELTEKYEIHGMMHITGGAFTKLKPLLHEADALISNQHNLFPQDIFYEMYKKGVSDNEMYKTFNCGIGFVLSAPEKEVQDCLACISKDGFKADRIGKIAPGKGKVIISSRFSNRQEIY